MDPIERELAHATDGWLVASVGRHYPDTNDGFLRMDAESGILGTRGYAVASQQPTVGGHAFVFRRMAPAGPPVGRRGRPRTQAPSGAQRVAKLLGVVFALVVIGVGVTTILWTTTMPLSAAENLWCGYQSHQGYVRDAATSLGFEGPLGLLDDEQWKSACRAAYGAMGGR